MAAGPCAWLSLAACVQQLLHQIDLAQLVSTDFIGAGDAFTVCHCDDHQGSIAVHAGDC